MVQRKRAFLRRERVSRAELRRGHGRCGVLALSLSVVLFVFGGGLVVVVGDNDKTDDDWEEKKKDDECFFLSGFCEEFFKTSS